MSYPWQNYRRLPKRPSLEDRHSRHGVYLNAALTNHITVPRHVSLEPAEITAEAWVYPRSIPADASIVSKHIPWLFQGYRLHNFGALWLLSAGDGISFTFIAGGNVDLNRWQFMQGIVTATGDMYLYKNLVLIASNLVTLTGLVHAVTQNLEIGTLSWNAGVNCTDSIVTDLRILPVALNQQQREHSFYRGYARRELDARLVMRLEEGSGLVANDESGYGNNGSLLPALTPPVWTKLQKYEMLAEAEA